MVQIVYFISFILDRTCFEFALFSPHSTIFQHHSNSMDPNNSSNVFFAFSVVAELCFVKNHFCKSRSSTFFSILFFFSSRFISISLEDFFFRNGKFSYGRNLLLEIKICFRYFSSTALTNHANLDFFMELSQETEFVVCLFFFVKCV